MSHRPFSEPTEKKWRNYPLLSLWWTTDHTENIPLVKINIYKKQIPSLSVKITCLSFQRPTRDSVDDSVQEIRAVEGRHENVLPLGIFLGWVIFCGHCSGKYLVLAEQGSVLVRAGAKVSPAVTGCMEEDRCQTPQHLCQESCGKTACQGKLSLWLLDALFTFLGCPTHGTLQLLQPLQPQQGWKGGKPSMEER